MSIFFGKTFSLSLVCLKKFCFSCILIVFYHSFQTIPLISPSISFQVLQWVLAAQNEILPYVSSGALAAKVHPDPTAKLSTLLQRLNDYLVDHTFLVGERITVADFAVFSALRLVYDSKKKGMMDGRLSVMRWYNTVVGQEVVQKVFK